MNGLNIPRISSPVLRLFRWTVRRYFRQNFHGVRVSGAGRFIKAGAADTPLIVYANHGSWWDPMVAILLADKLMRQRKHYAPMDAESLERYKILQRLGIFPVEMKTSRGAIQFLRTGKAILLKSGVLWVTPQGQFVDARARPLIFKPGLAALAARVAASEGICTVIPLAIEYPFWDERLPECLLEFGKVVQVQADDDAKVVETRLTFALEMVMEELKSKALRRNAAEFEEFLRGTSGAGGLYQFWQKMKAILLRRPYRAGHATAVISAKSGSKMENHGA